MQNQKKKKKKKKEEEINISTYENTPNAQQVAVSNLCQNA